MFSLIDKEAIIRRFNQSSRDINVENSKFEVVGRVLFVGKALDSSGN